MKKRFVKMALLSAMLFAASPASAQSVDDKIRSLEQELTQLKEQQIELKKEATAAAAAMPTFQYRPGNGVMVEAADKAWSVRFSTEAHFRMLFETGLSEAGRTRGEVMGRRLRPYFFYCINNCLFETEIGFDLDGFGTGNAKNSLNTGGSSIMQRGVVHVNLDQLNPFLPAVDIGMDLSTTGAAAISRQGSSDTGVQLEYDLWSRNVSVNTGRAGQGINLRWDDRSLSSIGIPGRISRFSVGVASINEADDGLSSFKDIGKNFDGYIGINPFSQIKNKWISGLLLEFGAWFCNNQGYDGNTDNGCNRVRVQDNGDNARQTLFDTGADSVGKGWYNTYQPGISWTIGPYRARGVYGWTDISDRDTSGGNANTGRKKEAIGWLVGNDLFIWSPKGFFTGSATTPGSVLLGYSYERIDLNCDNCTGGHFGGATPFHRNRVIAHGWGLAYFFAPRMSLLGNVTWYDAANLPGAARTNLGFGTRDPRRGGEWVDGSLTLRVSF